MTISTVVPQTWLCELTTYDTRRIICAMWRQSTQRLCWLIFLLGILVSVRSLKRIHEWQMLTQLSCGVSCRGTCKHVYEYPCPWNVQTLSNLVSMRYKRTLTESVRVNLMTFAHCLIRSHGISPAYQIDDCFLYASRFLVNKNFLRRSELSSFNPVFDWKPVECNEYGSYMIIFPNDSHDAVKMV